MPSVRETRDVKPRSATFLSFCAVMFFLIGGVLFMDGFVGNADGSAIRQTVLELRFGFGATVMVLSLILWAIARLIEEKT